MKKLTKLYTGLLFVTSIVGCNSASSINETVLATHYDKNTVSYQKQGAAVSLVNRQVNLDAAGVQYEVDLAINSKYSSGNMTVSIKSSEGLYIVGSQTDVEETLIKGSISIPLTVTASESGRYYLYAVVNAESNGVKRSRALTLIVQVGDQAKAAVDKLINGSKISLKENSESIKTFGDPVSLKADEEIIQ